MLSFAVEQAANMRYFTVFFFVFLSFLGKSQRIEVVCDQKLFREDFEQASSAWEQRYTSSELLLTEKGHYRIRRNASTFHTAIFPTVPVLPDIYQLETRMLLSKSSDQNKAAGLMFWVNETSGDALSIQFNNHRSFRVEKFLQGQILHPIGESKNDYWIRHKALSKKGKYNLIRLVVSGNSCDVYFNNAFAISLTETELGAGGYGLIVKAGSEVMIDYIDITVPSEIPSSQDQPGSKISEDASLQEIVLLFKSKIDKQQKEIKQLEQDLSNCRNKPVYDTATLSKNRELERNYLEASQKIRKMETELEEKKKRLEYLESFKQDIEKSNNGDIILNLTQMLADEKRKNRDLLLEIEKLKQNKE